MIRRHDSVLGEHKVDGATCLPSLELDRHRGVGLGVPLGDLLEAVHDVPRQGLRHILWQLELLLLVEKSCPILVKFCNMNQLKPDGILFPERNLCLIHSTHSTVI